MKTLLLACSLLSLSASAATPDFSFRLFDELAKKPGNFFFSPYSVTQALAMAGEGAKGETRKQMLNTLGLSEKSAEKLKAQREAIFAKGPGDGPVLTMANRLWAKTGQVYNPDFLKITETSYQASLAPLDYAADPEAARKTINDWVAENTHQKIQDLMPKGSINKSTDLVLTNAIYFKGAWQFPFQKGATKEEPFYPAGKGKSVNRPFMRSTEHVNYAADENFQAIRLPYRSSTIVMTILLPQKGKSLRAFSPENFASLKKKFLGNQVHISLPKFRVEYSAALEKILPKLGMPLPFSAQANFSGIRNLNPDERLYIGVVAHKAFIDVDENGTEAAAATGVSMALAAAMPLSEPVEFKANRPFIYLMEDLNTQTVLFLGRMEKP